MSIFHTFLRMMNDHISKTKNRKIWKIDFLIRFRTLRNFLDQKLNLVTFEKGGGVGGRGWIADCMSLNRNNPKIHNLIIVIAIVISLKTF